MLRSRTPGGPSHLQERYVFKYIRLKCVDMARTIEFYQSLGMSIDWEANQFNFLPPAPATTVEKDKDRDKREVQELLMEKDEPEKLVALSYRPTGKEVSTHNVQLILQRDSTADFLEEVGVPVPSGGAGAGGGAAAGEPVAARETLLSRDASVGAKKPHNYEYLVIYVHFVQRLAKRLQGKGFELVLEPLSIAEVKMCIMRDPNGMEVRLMELTDSQLNVPSTKKQWYARLGYYVVPTAQAEATVRWYETILATTRTRTAQGQRITTLDLAGSRGSTRGGGGGGGMGGLDSKSGTPSMDSRPISRKKPGAAATVRQAITQGQGFRLVDTEDFIVGLSRSLYYWLGNDLRSASCSICFTEHADFGTRRDGEMSNRRDSKLLGFGFEVPNMDAVINQLRYEFKDDLEWARERQRIQGVGTVVRLFDKVNQVWIELFAQKGAEKEVIRAGGEGGDGAGGDGLKQGPKIEYAIDFNHLSGHARVLSAGAVYRVRRPEDTTITLAEHAKLIAEAGAPLPPPRPTSAQSEAASETSMGSSQSLHMVGRSNDDIRPQPPDDGAAGGKGGAQLRNTKAVREARAAREQRYAFLSRHKSGSATW
ncbi:hypothetical protein HKX48_002688 [Thoreauomyces humboldtii]|nr:hypothetical protein HKX48_002688 [Thoreauomyces humboldtii]